MLIRASTAVQPFLASSQATYSAGEALHLAQRVASRLRREMPSGSRVALHCRDDLADPLSMLALMLAECVPFPLRSELPLPMVESIVRKVGATLAPVHEWMSKSMQETPSEAGAHADPELAYRVMKRAMAASQVMSATSGSSGVPKVVMHSMRRAMANARAHAESVHMGAGALIMTALPFAFSFQCLTLLLSALCVHGSLHLYSHHDPGQFARSIAQHRPDFVNFTPYLLRSFVRNHGLEALSAAVTVTVGGARVEQEDLSILRRLAARGHRCFITYGATECGPRIATAPIDAGQPSSAGLVGKPLVGVQTRICPISNVIEIKTDYLALGFCRPDTRELLVVPTRDGWFRTSDLGRIDEAGDLYVEGRTDRLIVRRDVKIMPEVVESIAVTMQGIAAALVRSERFDGVDHLVCYVQLVPGEEVTLDSMRKYLQERLPTSYLPTRVVLTDQLLVNQVGKIDYQQVLVPYN